MQSKTRRPRFDGARQEAIKLLRLGRITEPPVPVAELAELLNATVHFEPFENNLSGMMFRRDRDSAVIGVNASHVGTRQRFTIAHELGHLVLHPDEQLHFDEGFRIALRGDSASLAIDPIEVEANQFAAELLMPAALLLPDLRAMVPLDIEDQSTLMALAKRYDVSLHAMTIRVSRFLAGTPDDRFGPKRG